MEKIQALSAEKEDFYSHLNMEDIFDLDYALEKRVCKDFKTKNSGEYHDLYVQDQTLLLADGVDNFRNMYLEIYDFDPTRFLLAPVLAW